MLLVRGYQTEEQITKTRHKLYFCSATWRIHDLKIWAETSALRTVWACPPGYLTYHWLNPSLHPRLFMSNGSSVSHFLPLSPSTFSPLLLLKQPISVNKHASNPAKNVLLSTGSPPLRTRKASFQGFGTATSSRHASLGGINPGPNLLNGGIQRCQDWLSGLTGDRCVYVRADVRAAGPPSDGTIFLFTLHAKCLEKCRIIAGVCIYMCVYLCVS